ncbi:MAG TPA: TauD/TfdA family dioxygenase [Blastocatellia bacterium]|jgi:alpha-ketoglutarate-dependent taurine dioxygenase|nr:TauD/TfdA family dioxygenase [Blastocatellia bacterium]
MKSNSTKPSLGKLSAVRPKAITVSSTELVKKYYFHSDETLPLVLEPATGGVDLLSWAQSNQGLLEKELLEHGAILFRRFNVDSAEKFEKFIAGVSGPTLEYRERSSPRSPVSGNIYTSTEYPPDQQIFLHNENSYAHVWPLRIFFNCQTPPVDGGQTPIADVRRVLRRLAPTTVEKFERLKVMYVRNFGNSIGLEWQTVFQTASRTAAEDYCREAGYEFEWKEDGGLRTRRVGQAVAKHPKTGERLWFNHAAFFHVSTLGPSIREPLLAQFDEEDLPINTYYGDGSPIEPVVLDDLREAYRQETVTFNWEKGDILMLDNMLTAHGRLPYTGRRKILVGMSQPFYSRELRGGE